MSDDHTYNGYTNYETWAVKLWIDNEQGSQEAWASLTQRIKANPSYENEFMELERRIVTELATALKNEHEDAVPSLEGFAGDLLQHSIAQVDWVSIAEMLIEEV
jgi:hypothetical protein